VAGLRYRTPPMSLTQAIVLAVIQGITEFLPISSSAHLILAPRLFGWHDQGLVFDIATNTGSMLAVMVYFWRDLLQLLRDTMGRLSAPRTLFATRPAPLGPALAIATLPILVAGALLSHWISTAARDPQLIAFDAIFFALVLFWADRTARCDRSLSDLRWRDALGIGLAQVLALMPGTSRSGVTMSAGLFAGFGRPEAARFSFLLSIPAGLAVLAWDVKELVEKGPPQAGWTAMWVGLVVSAITSYLVIGFLLAWLRRAGMTPFVVYRILLGLTILAVYQL
jgi:undecaprenyl-diphosphatase